MARPLRVQFSGAFYHVTSRGNEKRDIFYDEHDREMFLENFGEVCVSHNWRCYAYCLMDNHYHLFIETIDATLAHGMRDLNGIYTTRFNHKHSRTGHVFQGRYKAFVVDSDAYLYEVARYVVLNPVRARLVGHPKDWKWSSYRYTAGYTKGPNWFMGDAILSMFSQDKKQAQKQYREFVQTGIDGVSPFDRVREGMILGDERFAYEVWERAGDVECNKELPRDERLIGRPSLNEIFEDITTKTERDDAIKFARLRCGYLNAEIARYIHLDPGAVGKIVRETYNKSKKV